MAQRNSSGRGGSATATKSRSGPAATQIRESDIAQRRVDDLRGELRRRGISGTSGLRKDDLVKRVVKELRADQRRGGAAKAGAPAKGAGKRTETAAGKATTAARGPGAKKSTTTARKSTSAAAKGTSGRTRQGGATSRTTKYAQRISSTQDRPERPGRSLVTTDHEVIKRWAQARNAKPATIENTEHDGHLGVLRFDFPGYHRGRPLTEVSWAEWLRTFDERQLNFIYQEQMRSGRPSNFFLLESPLREDG
ncbi:SAP domain-containing protein [Polymorphospora rubra]|nr:SAP domain-containing protein [Polymorphospora rubra]